jgi:hypothetical protein
MADKQPISVDYKGIAMEAACEVANMYILNNVKEDDYSKKLSSYANLVSALYFTMIGQANVKPEEIQEILSSGTKRG